MAEERRIPEHVTRLLASSIETVERLEMLLFLRSLRGRAVDARAVAKACAVSPAAAGQDLAILCGRGFLSVTIANDLLYAYRPLSPSIHAVVDELERLNDSHRVDVVAALNDRRDRDPVRAFANAFLVYPNAKARKEER